MDIDWILLLVIFAKCAFAVGFVMSIVPLMIWAERKGAAYIQDRPGPNRANILGIRAGGLVHTLNDVVKLIVKEDIIPTQVEMRFWFAAPVIAMTVALSTFVVVPWGDYLDLSSIKEGLVVPLQVADINAGLLYILAITSLGVYGIMLAGWSSNNKFSLLGGLRSSAQMISYELAMGLAVVAMFMGYGTTQLDDMVSRQAGSFMNWGIFQWGAIEGISPLARVLGPVVGIVAFVLFLTSVFAETNRNPFDLPEGESELVAGYHTEYSSLRFALFFMAEYANMVVAATVTTTIFFGGYEIPWVGGETLRAHTDTVLMAVGAGAAVVCPIFAWIAFRRRNTPFNQALRQTSPNDPRLREWKFWVVVWLGAAAANVGLIVVGLSGTVGATGLGPEIVAFVAHLNMLLLKVLFFAWLFIWVRWTLPRFRYDQLMNLGWKYMLPIAIANVMLAGIFVIARSGVGV